MDEIKQSGRSLDLALDGQCDSPGHNASYNTVSAMDVSNNKILNFRIVHVKVSSRLILFKGISSFFDFITYFLFIFLTYFLQEVTSSQAMEKEAFIRCVTDIQENLLVPIRVISTDRHASIKKLMRTDPRFTNILNQFDAWHIGKGLIKKLLKLRRKKVCDI